MEAALRKKAEALALMEASLRERAEAGKKYAEAGMMLSQRKWDEAEKIMSELPPHAAAASIYSVLGLVHAYRGHWATAITNYSLVVQVVPDDPNAYHQLAALLVKVGDVEGYRRHCQKLLQQFGKTSDPNIAERTAKACLILPQSGADPATISRLADIAVASGPTNRDFSFFQLAKGLSEFRQGRFASAIDWLKPVVAEQGDPNRAVQASMVLAMAQYRVNQLDAARETFMKGNELARRRVPGPDGPIPENRWNDWIFMHTLIGEAKTLIEGQ